MSDDRAGSGADTMQPIRLAVVTGRVPSSLRVLAAPL